MNECAKHLAKKHADALQSIQLLTAQYLMFAGAQYFRSQDPIVTEAQNIARHRIRNQTNRFELPDAKIEERARALGLPDEQERAVMAWVQEVRDVIQERGAFNPEPQPVVTGGVNGKQ